MKLQKVKIYDKDLNEKVISIPIQNGERIMAREIFDGDDYDILGTYKKYAKSMGISSEQIDAFKMMESNTYDAVVSGEVTSYNEVSKHASVQVSPKHSVVIDVCDNPVQNISVGNSINLSIWRKSKKYEPKTDATSQSFQQKMQKNELIDQITQQSTAYPAYVESSVTNYNGDFCGYKVIVSGVACFMPLSEVDIQMLTDDSKFLGKTVYVLPINYVDDKDIVVSHKRYLNIVRASIINNLLETHEKVESVINAVKEFGVFVTIKECINALLSAADMDEETKAKLDAGKLKVGDTLTVMLDAFSDDRAIVTQSSHKADCWNSLSGKVTATRLQHKVQFAEIECCVIKITSRGYIFNVVGNEDVTFFISNKFASTKYENGGKYKLKVCEVDTNRRSVKLYTA